VGLMRALTRSCSGLIRATFGSPKQERTQHPTRDGGLEVSRLDTSARPVTTPQLPNVPNPPRRAEDVLSNGEYARLVEKWRTYEAGLSELTGPSAPGQRLPVR
jgi:hypothetical protein